MAHKISTLQNGYKGGGGGKKRYIYAEANIGREERSEEGEREKASSVLTQGVLPGPTRSRCMVLVSL